MAALRRLGEATVRRLAWGQSRGVQTNLAAPLGWCALAFARNPDVLQSVHQLWGGADDVPT